MDIKKYEEPVVKQVGKTIVPEVDNYQNMSVLCKVQS